MYFQTYFLVIFAFIFIVPLIVVALRLKRSTSPYSVIFESIVLTALAVTAMLLVAYTDSGVSLGDWLINSINEAAKRLLFMDDFAEAAGLGDMPFEERVNFLVSSYGMMNSLLPSAIIITAAVVSYFIYMILSAIYRSVGGKPAELVPLRYFRWPQNTMAGFLVMFLLSFAAGLMPPFEGTQIYMNISVIFEFVMAVQGLGVIFMIFNLKRIPKAFAVVGGGFCMLTSFGRMILFAIGAFDYMLNIRGRIDKR